MTQDPDTATGPHARAGLAWRPDWERIDSRNYRAAAPVFGAIRLENYSGEWEVTASAPGYSGSLFPGSWPEAEDAMRAAETHVTAALLRALPIEDYTADLEAENARLRAAIDASLSERMVAAGMIPLEDAFAGKPFSRFRVHTGMKDMTSFGAWLDKESREVTRMQAAHECGEHVLDDEIADFVLGKAAVLKDVVANYRAARGNEEAGRSSGKEKEAGIE